ncbi:hypothetical protein TSO221_20610 [Azospirillum sp. TSO22-1]|nr:hypothetical protein TSO221_20610 [Azospirillum sp. TSO22-1]
MWNKGALRPFVIGTTVRRFSMSAAMMRSASLRLLASFAVLLAGGAFAFDRLPNAFGPGDAAKVSARATTANPAWGKSGTGYRYAFDGKCDDPRYAVTTGAADPGTDDYDCARVGGGLKK